MANKLLAKIQRHFQFAVIELDGKVIVYTDDGASHHVGTVVVNNLTDTVEEIYIKGSMLTNLVLQHGVVDIFTQWFTVRGTQIGSKNFLDIVWDSATVHRRTVF